MKKIFALLFIASMVVSCSEDIMDDINKDRNNAQDMDAMNLLPDLILKSTYGTAATDLAWYATVFIEHNAGTWAQSWDADRRANLESSSLLNNSWNGLYNVMNSAKTIIDKTDPNTGSEPGNFFARGIAQILMGYNLATATDFWGKIPYSEAFQGAENLQPTYQNQSTIYPIVISLLQDGIENVSKATRSPGNKDLIYGGSAAAWVKAGYSFLARYHMQLSNVDPNASVKALEAAAKGFASAAEQFLLTGFAIALPGSNPWGEFWYFREHLSVSSTIDDLLTERNDPRKARMYNPAGTVAPIGTAAQTQGGYVQSNYTSGFAAMAQPVVVFTYQELKFIVAEAKFRTGDDDWQDALEEAVQASFDFHGAVMSGNILDTANVVIGSFNYFEEEVLPRLTPGNELNEIMTQKYIAFFDREAIQAYNDYRRTGLPAMKNPNNAIVGFPHRAPYPVSEVSSNSANVPTIDIYTDKIWWAGGTE
jgi:hypothetical protein